MNAPLTAPDPASNSPHGPVPWLAAGLLAAGILVLAVVPDVAVLRQKVLWGEGLLLLAACLVFAEQSVRGRYRLSWGAFLGFSLLLVGLAAGLAARADLLSGLLARDEVERLLLVPVLFWTVSCVAARTGPRRLLLWALVLGLLPAAGYAVAQRLAGILELPITRTERSTSFFGNPLFLGAWLVLVTPPVAALALYARGALRWVAAVATGLALPALLATGSRWAWLGLGLALLTMVVLLAPAGRTRRRLIGIFAVSAIVVILVNLETVRRPTSHTYIWRDSWAMAIDEPLGFGPGQFQLAFLPYASEELLEEYPRHAFIVNDAHSEPLQILVELGWPGLLLLLCAGGALLVSSRAVLAVESAERPLVVGCAGALVGAMGQSFGSPDLRFHVSTMTFAVVAGLVASFAPARVLPVPLGRFGRSLGLLLALAAAFGVLSVSQERREIASLITPPGSFERDPDMLGRILELRGVVLADPLDAEAHYDLGAALARFGDFRGATSQFGTALILSPGNISVIRSLGIVEALSGRVEAARPHLDLSARFDPTDVDVRYLFAIVSYVRGDIATAMTEVEAVLEHDPEHKHARILRQKLRE